MCVDNGYDVFSGDTAHFYTVSIKNLREFIISGEVFMYQI